jgi:hypothetical protein
MTKKRGGRVRAPLMHCYLGSKGLGASMRLVLVSIVAYPFEKRGTPSAAHIDCRRHGIFT